uniref:Zinc transporter ZIP3 n=1 Tax=Panagrellus redivivus TaxID=6233 RepID=A0A7E4W461_PANRE
MLNTTLKYILLFLMLVLTLVFGLMPIKLMQYLRDGQREALLRSSAKKNWAAILISLITCFAGGVFLGIIFLDLMPDAREALEYVQSQGRLNIDYPILELLVLLGFFLVYFVEELTVTIFGEHSHGHDQTLVTQNPNIFNNLRKETGNGSNQSCEIHGHDVNDTVEHHVSKAEEKKAIVKSFTFVLALIFHSSLEGFALGVQSSEVSIISLFCGIVIHKSIVAFCVGMRLTKCHPNNVAIVVILTVLLAITSPVFGVFGTILQDSNFDVLVKNEVSFVLISASMGTFLYIGFFEMLAPERLQHHASFINMVATFVGFAITAVVVHFSG